jgi:glycosyltransferase involved in cell wall biosynthesis
MPEPNVVVLATSDYYLPGNKGGGAVRALANLVSHLGNSAVFKVITRDRDLGDEAAYPRIAPNCWNRLDGTEVMYVPPKRPFLTLLKLLRGIHVDILYLNSCFSPLFSVWVLLLRRCGLVTARAVIVAPRGEFSSGAVNIKRLKKRVYIALAHMLQLYKHVTWHVSTEYERADVQRYWGRDAQVVIARDCLPKMAEEVMFPSRGKTKGRADIVFLSRICRKKNLDGALATLAELHGEVRMCIYGPQEDSKYWQECRTIMDRLPTNIRVEYCGIVAHEEVLRVLAGHHLFFLPTHGENFGFVIVEALLAGCPVLISDQTPWRDLRTKGVGWELPLAERQQFREILQTCIDMDQAAFSALSSKAWEYGMTILREDPGAEQSSMLFKRVLASRSAAAHVRCELP